MQRVADLDTPSMVVDLDRLEGNIARLQASLDELGLANRPHIKTHKIPAIGHMQVAAGAIGITCQKLGEAEVFADAGFHDILVPYNLVGGPKLERLTRLARRVKMTVAVDGPVTAREILANQSKLVEFFNELPAAKHRRALEALRDSVPDWGAKLILIINNVSAKLAGECARLLLIENRGQLLKQEHNLHTL